MIVVLTIVVKSGPRPRRARLGYVGAGPHLPRRGGHGGEHGPLKVRLLSGIIYPAARVLMAR
jgi:hypothetical protein